MDIDKRTAIAENNLQRLLSLISSIDNKCAILIAINTALLGILITIVFSNDAPCWGHIILFILCVLLLTASLSITFWGSYPQTKGPVVSLLYPESIAKLESSEYEEKFLTLEDEDYLKDLINQCHRNAEISISKYKRLKLAYWLLFAGLLTWLVNLYLL